MKTRTCAVCGQELTIDLFHDDQTTCLRCLMGWATDASLPQSVKLEVRENHRGKCTRCGRRKGKKNGQAIEIHHIKPKSVYPEFFFDLDNLTPLCTACHVHAHKQSGMTSQDIFARRQKRIAELNKIFNEYKGV